MGERLGGAPPTTSGSRAGREQEYHNSQVADAFRSRIGLVAAAAAAAAAAVAQQRKHRSTCQIRLSHLPSPSSDDSSLCVR